MTRTSKLLVLWAVFGAGCGHRDDQGASSSGSGSASKPAREDLVGVAGGRFEARGLKCTVGAPPDPKAAAPDYRLSEHDGAPFDIDRRVVTCAEYKACVAAHACPPDGEVMVDGNLESTGYCWSGIAKRSLDAAKAYCGWRGARLPSFLEWQRAVLGPTGAVFDSRGKPCDATLQPEPLPGALRRCRFTSAAGVEFTLLDPLMAEWTRDADCAYKFGDLKTRPLAIDLLWEQIPSDVSTGGTNMFMGTAEFRCVRDTVSLEK